MDDKEYKRLKRIILILSFILFAGLLILAFWGTYAIQDIKERITKMPQQSTQVVKGIDGTDGRTPILGVDYFNGTDGTNGRNGRDSFSTHTLQPIVTTTPSPGPAGEKGNPGEKGEQGEPGPPGVAVYIRDADGIKQCRYAGDMSWQPISECSSDR